ncbi:MAG TPA: hypothetical protein VHO06_08775 [Polyangia bacterium]|nr:hypothetical protein [Polyangia bacterium]
MDQPLKTQLDRHPYGALVVALGAGYVLGGGIFTPLTARLARFALKVGIRAALVPMLTSQIAELVRPSEKNAAPAPPSPGNDSTTSAA